MRPDPSDPERTVSVAIVATRLRSERLGELRPEPGPRRIGETRIDSRSHSRIGPTSQASASSRSDGTRHESQTWRRRAAGRAARSGSWAQERLAEAHAKARPEAGARSGSVAFVLAKRIGRS
jgi:hypothetical protein